MSAERCFDCGKPTEGDYWNGDEIERPMCWSCLNKRAADRNIESARLAREQRRAARLRTEQ